MIDKEKVLQLRSEGRSLRSIGQELGCSHVAILKLLKKKRVGNFTEGGNSKGFLKKTFHARPLEEKTPPYFIKDGTDEIFCYTRFLAERPDMKPYWGTLEEFRAKGKK